MAPRQVISALIEPLSYLSALLLIVKVLLSVVFLLVVRLFTLCCASAEPTHFKSKVKPLPVGTCSISATSLLFTEFPVLDAGLPLLSRMSLWIKAIFMNASKSLLKQEVVLPEPSYFPSPLPWMQRKLNNSMEFDQIG